MKSYRFLPVIAGIFTATLLISAVICGKLLAIGPLTLSAGIIIFPLSYLANDVLTEVYGYRVSRQIIWTGLLAELLMTACCQAALTLPAASYWENQEAYQTVLGTVPRVVIASILAYFAGEFCNSYALAKLKIRMNGKGMSLRFVASTALGELVDSVVFFPLAFYGVFPNTALAALILSSWAAKVLWEIVALPVTLPFVRWLKRAENEDYFDRKTNFYPFCFDSAPAAEEDA